MQEDYFNDGSKTLVILCEEGEEEYPEKMLRKTHSQTVVVDDPEGLYPDKLEELQKTYQPERVLIEYNGMWSVPDFLNTPLPENWLLYQIITILDSSTLTCI